MSTVVEPEHQVPMLWVRCLGRAFRGTGFASYCICWVHAMASSCWLDWSLAPRQLHLQTLLVLSRVASGLSSTVTSSSPCSLTASLCTQPDLLAQTQRLRWKPLVLLGIRLKLANAPLPCSVKAVTSQPSVKRGSKTFPVIGRNFF